MSLRARLVIVVGLALAVIGCAEEPPFVAGDDEQAERGTDGPAAEPGDTVDDPPDDLDGLLDGVPSNCSLLAEVDDALRARLVDAIDPAVDHGPLVVVEVEGERVVATTTYTEPGVEGDAAVWHLSDDGPVSISDEAARISTVDVDLRDSAGTDPVARARAEASDCSWIAADRSAEDPPPPEPRVDEDLIVAEPDVAASGDTIAMHFPQETLRGLAFDLDRHEDGTWTTTHWMTSDANGGDPMTVPEGTEGFAVPDIGIGGPGPDHVVLSDDLEPGEYRICTANAPENICALLEIST